MPELLTEPRPPAGARASAATNPLGVDRGHYIALRAPEPAAAAAFAVAHMGFSLVHADDDGRHYLAAAGLDPYSLVYSPGDPGVDHVSYLVRDQRDLDRAEALLRSHGVATERPRQPLWRHAPALRFTDPTGTVLELTTGVNVEIPMGALIQAPAAAPGPISFDHAMVRATDLDAALDFARGPFGLKESGMILADDGQPLLSFFRAHTLYHCYAVARSPVAGLHHYQFTIKDAAALDAASEALRAGGEVEVVWGPVRHATGNNVSIYFRDAVGYIVELSAHEEIIFNDEAYQPRHWPAGDSRAVDEWGSSLPAAMGGAPPEPVRG
jgi:catechol 2,3-dioxygenase-like lactoylglutathione lyase family enzyme